VSGDGVQFDRLYSLPPSNWSYIGPPGADIGYRYKDSTLALGPIRGVAIRDARVSSVLARWPKADMPLDADPTPVGVVLTLGGTRYCMSFGGTTAFVPDIRYGATDAPAPAECAR